MTNCIWVKQYMRQGTLVREHQRCYNRPLSKADKDLYEEVQKRERSKWDEYEEAAQQQDLYAPLVTDAQARNSPLLPSIQQQQDQANNRASKKFDDWIEESIRADKLTEELGIKDDPYKKQLVTPEGIVIDNPIPYSQKPKGKPKGATPEELSDTLIQAPNAPNITTPTRISAPMSPTANKPKRRRGAIGLIQGLIGRKGSTGSRGSGIGRSSSSSRSGGRGSSSRRSSSRSSRSGGTRLR